MSLDFTIKVGGEAGQGVQSVGFWLAKAFARGGLYVFADQDYESRIRGGHNFFRIRVREQPVQAISEADDLLIALNQETVTLHKGTLRADGALVYDQEQVAPWGAPGLLAGAPLKALAREHGGSELMANTVAAALALGLVGYDYDLLAGVLRDQFQGEIAEANLRAARAGYDYAREHFAGFSSRVSPQGKGERLLVSGNEAIALGALAAGCRFMTGYPMTPATSIMEFLAARSAEYGLVVVQAEDEISVINIALGASFAGVRAMVATSGGGYSLMVEATGLAGMTETPIVIVEGQRPGPSTGLPTRTEQGDLEFILHAAQGEFPRVVLSPATIEDCFYQTVRAFNFAEKYQCPAFLLYDQYLATSYETVPPFDLSRVRIERGELVTDPQNPDQYQRHLITPLGASPRAIPGGSPALVLTTGDEHDESGHINEDTDNRTQQVLKRLRKLEGARRELDGPYTCGPRPAQVTLVGWGSTYGPLREAVDRLNADGLKTNLLHIAELLPFPAEAVTAALKEARRVLVVEQNATGQLARVLRTETGIKADGRVLKFNGRPFSPAEIALGVRQEVGR